MTHDKQLESLSHDLQKVNWLTDYDDGNVRELCHDAIAKDILMESFIMTQFTQLPSPHFPLISFPLPAR